MNPFKTVCLATLSALFLVVPLTTGTASGTELYSGVTTLKSGTILGLSFSGGFRIVSTGGSVIATCTGGSVSGKTTNTGGAGVNVTASFEKSGFTYTGCTKTTDSIEGGTMEFAYTSGLNANVSGKGFKVTVETIAELGGTCAFTWGTGGTNLGTLVGSTTGNAVLTINTVLNGASGNAFLCPTSVKWEANLTWTSPKPAHATNS